MPTAKTTEFGRGERTRTVVQPVSESALRRVIFVTYGAEVSAEDQPFFSKDEFLAGLAAAKAKKKKTTRKRLVGKLVL